MSQQHEDQFAATTSMPQNLAINAGITAVSVSPIYAAVFVEAGQQATNWTVILSVIFFIVGQGLQFGYKEFCRWRDRQERRRRIEALGSEEEE